MPTAAGENDSGLTTAQSAGPAPGREAKVLELCLSRERGGLELYMLRVTRWLARSGVPFMAVVASGGELESRLREHGVPYRPLRTALPWFPAAAARRLAGWIDAEGIDVIHLHWARDLTLAVLARRFARRAVRIVYTRQMAITRPKRDGYHRALYRRVDLMLVITRRLQEEARRFLPLPPERVQLLYHGIPAPSPPSARGCAELRGRAGVPPEAFLIGLIGRIEPAKGQHVLVDAVGSLAARGCDAHAVLLGHAMQPRYLEDLRARIARAGLDARVRHHDFHPRAAEIMGCFDCMVLTTYNETFGLVLIEAMRAGVAVIGTDAGGVPEIIDDGKTGLLVPPGDAAALADAIERLARDPALRERLAAAGKASADARFDEERHFARLNAWLREEAPR